MKEKIYYFQEKSNDILDLQDEFSVEEIGMLFILKAAYFKYSGELKEENICQRCKFFGDKNKLEVVAKKLFTVEGGLLINNSWLSEIKEIKERSIKRRDAANKRWEDNDKPKPKKAKEPKEPERVKTQFEEFWNLYNKKTSRPDAEKKFKAALKIDTFENILAGLNAYVKTRSPDSKFWKDPSTWLNKQCWKDEYNNQSQSGAQSNKNENLTVFINNLINDTLLTSISVSDSNKAVLRFKSKSEFDKFVALPENLKNEVKQEIAIELLTKGFEPKY